MEELTEEQKKQMGLTPMQRLKLKGAELLARRKFDANAVASVVDKICPLDEQARILVRKLTENQLKMTMKQFKASNHKLFPHLCSAIRDRGENIEKYLN